MNRVHGAQIARSRLEREQLAKEWLLRLIERTPLADLGELPVAWIVAEAPALIADILGRLETGGDADSDESRLASLRGLRAGPEAPEQIPRDLAMLQALLVESLGGDAAARRSGEFANSAQRLAEVFGEIQGAVARSLLDERSDAPADRTANPVQSSELAEWMRALLAGQRRHGHGFALALIDVDGLGRINDAYGREAGDRLLGAIGDVIRGQVRATDHAFRLDDDEFAVLAPHCDVAGLLPMAQRVVDLIESSQAPEGPRIAVAVGVAACPGDGETGETLLESATAATYAAKAAGKAVGTNPKGPRAALQDP